MMEPKSTDAERPQHPRALGRTAVKAGAVAVLLLLAPGARIPAAVSKALTLIALQERLLATVYVLTAVLGVIATIGVPFLRSRWLRWPLVVVSVTAFGLNYVAQSIQGEPLSSHMLATFVEAWKEYDHALLTYPWQFLAGAVLVVALAPCLLSQPAPRVALGRRFLMIPATAMALTSLLIGTFPGRLEDLPSTVAVPAQALFAVKEASVYMGPRDAVVYSGAVQPKYEKVILIVDEGVRADYLQINNTSLDNTPFLQTALPTLANFGRATSFSNCSATARVSLRSGARDEDFPDPGAKVLRRPTFWQFAKRAGYRTVYIDTWLPVRKMSSMLTYHELTFIDERAGVPLAPYAAVDDRVVDRILAEVNSPGRTFLFVEKIGLHSPYARNLPHEPAYAPRTGQFLRPDLDAPRARNIRDYLIGVWWRVDRFFERLLPAIKKPGVLLIYTSDHGQSLYDASYDATNCSGPNAVQGEGIVPMLVFASDEATRKAFQSSATSRPDMATHDEVFPTLLWAMGFDPSLTEPRYATSLLSIPSRDSRRFFVFSPFRDEVQWVVVH